MAGAPLAAAVSGPGRYLRPTGVRTRPSAGQNIGIAIIGLRDAEKIPAQLRTTFDLMMRRLTHAVEVGCKEVVPGGPEGRLGRQVHARIVHGEGRSNRIVIGTIGSEFARALDRGFTSKASTTGGKALRFSDSGSEFYRPKVHVAGRHFFAKWLALTPPLVESIYEASFYNIRDLL
jgi:hypothetical protein